MVYYLDKTAHGTHCDAVCFTSACVWFTKVCFAYQGLLIDIFRILSWSDTGFHSVTGHPLWLSRNSEAFIFGRDPLFDWSTHAVRHP